MFALIRSGRPNILFSAKLCNPAQSNFLSCTICLQNHAQFQLFFLHPVRSPDMDKLISHQKVTSNTLYHLRNSEILLSLECVTTEIIISLKEDSLILVNESSERC